MISLTEDNRMLGYEALHLYSDIFHFVTTRHGGVGGGTYASFNCSHYCGDEPGNVRENRARLLGGFPQPPIELIVPVQTHGVEILHIEDSFHTLPAARKEELLHGIDAVMTSAPGYCICVSTADCVPVLLYDLKHRAIAAVHAGWRGTVAYILHRTLQRMNRCFGTEGGDVVACIGPSISRESFEVGEEVYEAFQQHDFDMSRISVWNERTRKHHIDLWEANRIQLLDFGVPDSRIELSGICTYTHCDEFFSARRLGIRSGRILAGIMLASALEL